jgi:hypothetical protein
MRATGARSRVGQPHVWLAAIGAGLVVLTSIVGSGFNLLSIPFAVWAALPYAALWFAGRWTANPGPILGAGAAALAADLGIRAAVFIWPRGSTAAIALVFSPAYIATIVMPAGAAAGWLLGKAWNWHAAGRALVLTVAPLTLGLLVLGLARPDLFPTTVARRRALLERIGSPRVVIGADRFEWPVVSTTSAWHQAANVDDRPGDEIVVANSLGADLFDATTLTKTSRVEFSGAPEQVWASFSALVRLPDGQLAVAQTGGGFSRTLLQDLSGTELWEFRPRPELPPDALRPADLDGDTEVEFYAAATDFVARLDATGQESWRQPANLAALLALLPASDTSPAWVVGLEYGRKVLVWDAAGRLLGERAATAEDSPLTAVDSFAGRALVHGGTSARGVGLDGTGLFDIPLGDFVLSQAIGVRLSSGQSPSLVLAGSTDRDTRRYRLLIVDHDRQVVYDEILDRYPRVLAARRADGSDTVLIGDETGLRALRPR